MALDKDNAYSRDSRQTIFVDNKPFDEESTKEEEEEQNVVDKLLWAVDSEDEGIGSLLNDLDEVSCGCTTSSAGCTKSTRSSKSGKSRDSASHESIYVAMMDGKKSDETCFEFRSTSNGSIPGSMGGGKVDETHMNERSLADNIPLQVHPVPSMGGGADISKTNECSLADTAMLVHKSSANGANVFEGLHEKNYAQDKETLSMVEESKLVEPAHEATLNVPLPPSARKSTPHPKLTSFISKLSPKVFGTKGKNYGKVTDNKAITISERVEDLQQDKRGDVTSTNEAVFPSEEVADNKPTTISETVDELQQDKSGDVEFINEAVFPSKSAFDFPQSAAAPKTPSTIIAETVMKCEQSKCSVVTKDVPGSSSSVNAKDHFETEARVQSSSSQENSIARLLGKLFALSPIPFQCNAGCAGMKHSERVGQVCSSNGLFYKDRAEHSSTGIVQSIVESLSFAELSVIESLNISTGESSLPKHDDSVDESLAVEAYKDSYSKITRIGFVDQEVTVESPVEKIPNESESKPEEAKIRKMNYAVTRNLFRRRQ